jgi:hypothetical protein
VCAGEDITSLTKPYGSTTLAWSITSSPPVLVKPPIPTARFVLKFLEDSVESDSLPKAARGREARVFFRRAVR